MARIGLGTRIAGAAVCGLLVLVIGSAAAQAAAPEYGRCIKLPKHSTIGGYIKKANCTVAAESKASYEWLPGPGAANRFTLAERYGYSPHFHLCITAEQDEQLAVARESEAAEESEPSEQTRLENEAAQYRTTAKQDRELAGLSESGCEKLIAKESARAPAVFSINAHQTVVCGGLSGAGEYSGPKTISGLEVTFTECQLRGTSCQSAGAGAGEIDTSALSGELAFIEAPSPTSSGSVGVDWAPLEGETWMQFECAAESVLVSGSLIHQVNSDKMAIATTESAHVAHGMQNPSSFEGLPSDVLSSSIGGEASEGSTLSMRLFVKNEEAIEANSVV